METIGNLLGLGSGSLRGLGIVTGAVTTDDTQLRVSTKPHLDGGAAAICKQVHDLVGLQIDDHRAIGLAFTKRKVIHPNLGWFCKNQWLLPAQLPTQRRDRGGQMQKARQPLCRFMSGGRT